MKKNVLKPRLSMVLIASFFISLMALTGCFNKSKINSMVPEDATVVLCVDLNSLWNKGNLDDLDKVSTVKYLRQELKDEDPDIAKIFDELLKDPNSCGLKLKGEMVAFNSGSLKSPFCIGFLVNKADQFEDFLTTIRKKLDVEMDISNEGAYRLAFFEDFDMAACWDNNKAYFITGVYKQRDVANDAEELMTLTKQNSIANNKDFNAFMKGKRDIRLFINTEKLASYLRKTEPSLYRQLEPSISQYKDASACLFLNFEKGAIKMESKYIGLDSKNNMLNTNFNSDLLNYLPEETFGAATLAFNMDQLLKELEKSDQVDLDESITWGGPSFRKVFSCFTGDIAANLSQIKYDRYDGLEPVITVAAGINNSRTLEKMFDDMEGDGIEYNGDSYDIPYTNFSIKIKDDVLLFSNDSKALNAFKRGGAGNGIDQVASKAKKGNYMYFNLDLDDYPSSLTRNLDKGVVELLSGFLKYAEVKTTGNYSGEITIYLKNDSMNSLEFMINYFDSLASLQRFL